MEILRYTTAIQCFPMFPEIYLPSTVAEYIIELCPASSSGDMFKTFSDTPRNVLLLRL